MRTHFNVDDGNFAVLDWVRGPTGAARVMVGRMLWFPQQVRESLLWSEFAQVPLGNLDTDRVVQCMDLMYARSLREHNHLLWASDSMQPDMGGVEDDDALLGASDVLLEAIADNAEDGSGSSFTFFSERHHSTYPHRHLT